MTRPKTRLRPVASPACCWVDVGAGPEAGPGHHETETRQAAGFSLLPIKRSGSWWWSAAKPGGLTMPIVVVQVQRALCVPSWCRKSQIIGDESWCMLVQCTWYLATVDAALRTSGCHNRARPKRQDTAGSPRHLTTSLNGSGGSGPAQRERQGRQIVVDVHQTRWGGEVKNQGR